MAQAIQDGEVHIDLAVIAAPAADFFGNANGVSGPAACGLLGFALQDTLGNFANGIMMSGGSLGALLAPVLMIWMANRWGWRTGFVILGALGIVWALAWIFWFRPPVEVLRGATAKGKTRAGIVEMSDFIGECYHPVLEGPGVELEGRRHRRHDIPRRRHRDFDVELGATPGIVSLAAFSICSGVASAGWST